MDEFNSDKLIIGKGGKAIFSGEDFFPFGKRTKGMRNLKQSSRSWRLGVGRRENGSLYKNTVVRCARRDVGQKIIGRRSVARPADATCNYCSPDGQRSWRPVTECLPEVALSLRLICTKYLRFCVLTALLRENKVCLFRLSIIQILCSRPYGKKYTKTPQYAGMGKSKGIQ